MKDLTHCPNCNTKLKGMISSIRMLSENEIKFAKDFGEFKGDSLCEKCSIDFSKDAKSKYISENGKMKTFLKDFSSSFPVVTLQNPNDWKYETLGIVTAQATMYNVVENKSLFDNLLEINQNLVNLDESVSAGENSCIEILRQKSYLLGGNAVLGVDIDYSEFGLKGELMLVCMAGTSVKIDGLEEKSKKYAYLKIKLKELESKLEKLDEHRNNVN